MTPKITDAAGGGFSDEERASMKARAAELKKEAGRGRGQKKATDELDVLEAIASMDAADRALAERVHAVVTTHAPALSPKLWYGQPAYARDGKVVCFFRSGAVDKERYSTFGFTPEAHLDDGGLWPTSFAVSALDDSAVETLAVLVASAVA
ncbi:DUF1801 domain-containing protein [Georgenia faecalis]|uniref:DUF1801 domain-containing protein n=1 Tax=Georgenia faecalis TaxID=2483799 RepID=UPI000FDB0822|nr:DUF1801 domain-containing protein [Georgenia faecalis]